MPCPASPFEPAFIEGSRTISVEPACADPRAVVLLTGAGFRANEEVQAFFVPPNGTRLRLALIRTDGSGAFQEQVRLPNRPDETVQTITVESEVNVGGIFNPVYVADADGDIVRSPRWSKNAIDTLDKIIETVFLALLATTAGTIIAIPLSFFAAKNLMRDVKIPALQLGLAIAGAPIGVLTGLLAFRSTSDLVARLPSSALVSGPLFVALVWLIGRLVGLAVPGPGSESNRIRRIAAGIGAGILILVAGQVLARFANASGEWASDTFTGVSFLGEFVATLGGNSRYCIWSAHSNNGRRAPRPHGQQVGICHRKECLPARPLAADCSGNGSRRWSGCGRRRASRGMALSDRGLPSDCGRSLRCRRGLRCTAGKGGPAEGAAIGGHRRVLRVTNGLQHNAVD